MDGLWLIPVVLGLAPFLGMMLARLTFDGGWHRRYRHRACGFHARHMFQLSPCERCGVERPEDIETITARAVPWGWEIKRSASLLSGRMGESRARSSEVRAGRS